MGQHSNLYPLSPSLQTRVQNDYLIVVNLAELKNLIDKRQIVIGNVGESDAVKVGWIRHSEIVQAQLKSSVGKNSEKNLIK